MILSETLTLGKSRPCFSSHGAVRIFPGCRVLHREPGGLWMLFATNTLQPRQRANTAPASGDIATAADSMTIAEALLNGEGMATAGLVIGYVFLALTPSASAPSVGARMTSVAFSYRCSIGWRGAAGRRRGRPSRGNPPGVMMTMPHLTI